MIWVILWSVLSLCMWVIIVFLVTIEPIDIRQNVRLDTWILGQQSFWFKNTINFFLCLFFEPTFGLHAALNTLREVLNPVSRSPHQLNFHLIEITYVSKTLFSDTIINWLIFMRYSFLLWVFLHPEFESSLLYSGLLFQTSLDIVN